MALPPPCSLLFGLSAYGLAEWLLLAVEEGSVGCADWDMVKVFADSVARLCFPCSGG